MNQLAFDYTYPDPAPQDCRPPWETMSDAELRRVFIVCESGELDGELEARGLKGKK